MFAVQASLRLFEPSLPESSEGKHRTASNIRGGIHNEEGAAVCVHSARREDLLPLSYMHIHARAIITYL